MTGWLTGELPWNEQERRQKNSRRTDELHGWTDTQNINTNTHTSTKNPQTHK